jgi:aminoglycoside phosphotransferase
MDEIIHDATTYLVENGFALRDYFRLSGGFTNQVYCLNAKDKRKVILKRYYADNKQRLSREFEMLRYLHAQGFKHVPLAYYRNIELNYALYSFIEGERCHSAMSKSKVLIKTT